jgi:hypothetical protein
MMEGFSFFKEVGFRSLIFGVLVVTLRNSPYAGLLTWFYGYFSTTSYSFT